MVVELASNQRAQRLKNQYIDRDIRIRKYYTQRRLIPEDIKNYESAKTNDPKNIVRLGTYLLSALPAKHRIPAEGQANEDIEKAAIVERALTAAWAEQDIRRRRTGQRMWRWQFADYLVMTGWYAVMLNVREDRGKPVFTAEIWNPGRAYPEWDGEELVAVSYEYDLGLQTLQHRAERYGWDLPGNTRDATSARVTQLWELNGGEVTQAILVGSHEAQAPKSMGLERIPVLIGVASGEGTWGGAYDGDGDWAKHFGESILEPNYELIETFNRWLTYHLQLARDAAQSTILHKRGAPGNVTPDQFEQGGAIIDLPGINEDVERLEPSQVPTAVVRVMDVLSEKIQQGGFVWSLFGSTGALNLSGFAIQQLLTSAYATVGEYYETTKSVMSEIDKYWLEEYRDSNFGPMFVVTRRSDFPGLIKEEFTRDMIPDQVYVEVDFNLAAPKDTFERMAAGRQAHPEGNLMDTISVLDEIMGVEDPMLVIQRLEDEAGSGITRQILEPLRAIGALRRKEQELRNGADPDIELADAIKAHWQSLLSQISPPGQQAPGRAPVGTPTSPPEARGEPRNMAQQLFGEQAPTAQGQGAGFPTTTKPSMERRIRGG
jgi:hypothetical protein